MTLEALRKLIAAGEGETLEFKATIGQREDACETLCGYLNEDGGTVIFGVTRKGELTGQLVSDKTKRELFEVFAKFEPSADIAVDWVDVESGSNLDQNLDHVDPDPIQIDPDVGGDIPRRLLSTLRKNPLISRKLLAVELNVSERKIRDSLKILV